MTIHEVFHNNYMLVTYDLLKAMSIQAEYYTQNTNLTS